MQGKAQWESAAAVVQTFVPVAGHLPERSLPCWASTASQHTAGQAILLVRAKPCHGSLHGPSPVMISKSTSHTSPLPSPHKRACTVAPLGLAENPGLQTSRLVIHTETTASGPRDMCKLRAHHPSCSVDFCLSSEDVLS